MNKLVLTALGCIAASFALAEPSSVPKQFADCNTLEECLHALNAIAPTRESGAGSPALDAQFAKRLESFGEPAKREVIKRAAGNDKGWRELAGWLLLYWKSFDESDVPALIQALHADPGFSPAGILGVAQCVAAK
jgi:hypothetical protein